MLLSNLKELREDMEQKGWTICSFIFSYKKIKYIVLVKRFVGTEKRIDDYALVKLHFMKYDNINDDMQVEASSIGLLVDAKTLREYFGIEYRENIGDILRQFTEQFGREIPKRLLEHVSDEEKMAMVYSLSISDNEDPSKIYCNKVKRNPNGGQRSEFNTDKTKLLRPTLFKYFCNDFNISFCYFSNQEKENDDATIIKNFSS